MRHVEFQLFVSYAARQSAEGTAVNYIKWHEDLHASEPGYKESSTGVLVAAGEWDFYTVDYCRANQKLMIFFAA